MIYRIHPNAVNLTWMTHQITMRVTRFVVSLLIFPFYIPSPHPLLSTGNGADHAERGTITSSDHLLRRLARAIHRNTGDDNRAGGCHAGRRRLALKLEQSVRSMYADANKCCRLRVRACRTLGSCAAVCRRWLPRSRSLQWEVLDFSDLKTYARVHRLFRLASSVHATIVPHIKRICLQLFEGNDINDDHVDSDGNYPGLTQTFREVRALKALQSIVIIAPLVSKIDADTVAEVLKSLTQLKSLELANFTLDSFEDLRRIIGSCVGLESLYLNGLWEIARPTRLVLPPPPCPPLKIFSAIDCSRFAGRLLLWMMEERNTQRPGTIFIGANDVHVLQRKFGEFLRYSGPALHKLCIEQNPHARSITDPALDADLDSEIYTPFEP